MPRFRCIPLPAPAPALPVLAMCLAACMAAQAAGPLRDRLEERRAALQEAGAGLSEDGAASSLPLPSGVRLLSDIAYGADPRQRMDVYLPAVAHDAPVIFMVHGGAWRLGDKRAGPVVDNKVRRWVMRGIILVSINYRMLPAAKVPVQAEDVAAALAFAQARAASWGGSRDKFVLMGHSAGAHLVALLNASRAAAPWLGTVALDSAAYDIAAIMGQRHVPLYDRAFGADPAYWSSVSPLARLQPGGRPLLAVCSTRRQDSCPQAQGFAERSAALGARVQLLRQDLGHGEINAQLGSPGAYTEAVEAFLSGLDAGLAARLKDS